MFCQYHREFKRIPLFLQNFGDLSHLGPELMILIWRGAEQPHFQLNLVEVQLLSTSEILPLISVGAGTVS